MKNSKESNFLNDFTGKYIFSDYPTGPSTLQTHIAQGGQGVLLDTKARKWYNLGGTKNNNL